MNAAASAIAVPDDQAVARPAHVSPKSQATTIRATTSGAWPATRMRDRRDQVGRRGQLEVGDLAQALDPIAKAIATGTSADSRIRTTRRRAGVGMPVRG